MKRLRVGIIGATGMVGQQFIKLLAGHPWFEVTCLAASPRSAGKSYDEAVADRWKLATPCPDYVKSMPVVDATGDLKAIAGLADVVFCALDMDKAAVLDLETAYAKAGLAVISTNSAHRWTADVPMLIPEVNSAHTGLIKLQRQQRGWKTGLIAVKPNCSIQSYVIALTALKAFQPQIVQVTSLQAISGAGRNLAEWPEMVDNVVPFITGEEDKSEREPLKILGDLRGQQIELAKQPVISASCVRVPVSDGHLADVSVKFGRPTTKTELLQAIKDFAAPLNDLGLPSSPRQLIRYFEAADRPQTKLDRDYQQGMGVTMGRLRQLPAASPYDWRFISLAHNTVRGAAGGAILMAELLVAQGYIGKAGGGK